MAVAEVVEKVAEVAVGPDGRATFANVRSGVHQVVVKVGTLFQRRRIQGSSCLAERAAAAARGGCDGGMCFKPKCVIA